MAFVTSKLPCHYVDYLCKPGLKTRGGIVPLQMYMGSHVNGDNSKSFLEALFSANLRDLDDRSWTPASCVPPEELAIMKKGQGNDVYYVQLWDWIWDNQEQLGSSKNPILQYVYQHYFVEKTVDPNGLKGMVHDAYFGNECIGFVSNYLRYIGFWKKYQGVDNHYWYIHFATPVLNLEDVRPLDLLEWTDVGHVALVDDVEGVTDGTLKLDVSQCSRLGDLKDPMSNKGVFLKQATKQEGNGGHTKYTLSGNAPVPGDLQIRRNLDLQYASPCYPYTPLEYPAAADRVELRK